MSSCKSEKVMQKPSPVKVVFIETQYVKTDELRFKSGVQKLTGKCPVMTEDLPKGAANVDEGIIIQDGDQGYVDHGVGLEIMLSDPLMASALKSPATVPEEVMQSYYVEPTEEEFYNLWS